MKGGEPTSVYKVPDMPLSAQVWLSWDGSSPPGPPTYETVCSVSPVTAMEWVSASLLQAADFLFIIRLPKGSVLLDNLPRVNAGELFPCSVIEAPINSGNYYPVIFQHTVGQGFSNEFRRAYCARLPPGEGAAFSQPRGLANPAAWDFPRLVGEE